ncbi:MAG: hypothetical protein HYX52_08810 [Chloroflexi bacterium]|nr:hypothetical protein [Chloroflexota bacterium]
MTTLLLALRPGPSLAAELTPLAPEGLRCSGLVDREVGRTSPDDTFGGWEYRWEVFSNDASITTPFGVAVDRACNVYVASYDPLGGRITKLSRDGAVLATWGSPGKGAGQFERLEGLAVDAAGNVYAADSGNNRVQRFTPSGTVDAVWTRESACPAITAPVKCNVVPPEAWFNGSLSVGVDGSGTLYVVDGAFGVKRFQSSGAYLGTWGTPLSDAPTGFRAGDGIAFDADGNVYIADALLNAVRKFTRDGALLSRFAIADETFVRLDAPRGVAVDTDGNVYVSDTDNQRMVVFAPEGIPLAWAGRCTDEDAVGPCPRTGIGDEPGQFAFPHHLVANGRGEVFLADRYNNRVQVLKGYPIWIPPAGAGGE